MLVEFSVENFLSFRDEQRFSMVAADDRGHADDTIATDALGKHRLLRSAAIYGPNAAGKTNLVKALLFVRDLITESPQRSPNQETGAQPFRLDDKTRSEASHFALTFVYEGVRYDYTLAVTAAAIEQETLVAYPKGRPQRWFERRLSNDDKVVLKIGVGLKGAATLKQLIRPKVAFLSVAQRFNHPQLSKVYDWFANKLVIMLSEQLSMIALTGGLAGMLVSSAPALHPALTTLLRQADLGIDHFTIRERGQALIDPLSITANALTETVWQSMSDEMKQFLSQHKDREVTFFHQGDSGSPGFSFLDESRGTRQLFALGPILLSSLQNGQTIIVDEIDTSLHPQIIRALVDLFNRQNPYHAQLIFNTHDASLLQKDLLERDQVWFVEKDNKGSTHLYCLLDFQSQENGESVEESYLYGRFGAVPLIDRLTWQEIKGDAAS